MRRMKEGQKDDEEDEGRQGWGECGGYGEGK